MGLLVVAAVKFEADPSLEFLRTLDPSVQFFELGIGPLNAARSSVALKNICRDRTVLYLGSCGSFYPFQAVHLVTVDTVFWMPPCLRTGIAGFPEHVHPPVPLPQAIPTLPVKSVLTAASISLTKDFAPQMTDALPPQEHLVENMELYACIEALQDAKALHVVLGVSNAVGSEGRSQWAQHFRRVAQLSAEFLASQADFCRSLLKS